MAGTGYASLQLTRQRNIYRKQLITATQSYDSLIAVFEQQYPEYYQLKHSSKTATIREVQDHLSDGEALIEYVVGRDSTYAFTITSDSAHFHLTRSLYRHQTRRSKLSNRVEPTK